MNKSRNRLRPSRIGYALGAGFLTLSFFIASAVIFSVQQQSSDAVVRRALGIEIDLAGVFSALQDAEIGQRGLLLTGDDAFLQPYRSASALIDARLEALGNAVAGIEQLHAPYLALKALAAEKQTEMAHTLALHQAGRQDEALAFVRAGGGKRLMDEIRDRIAAMDLREDGIVEQRQATLRRIGLLTAISTTIAVLLLGGVALAAMREVRRRGELSRFLPAEIAPRLAEGDRSLTDGREVPTAIVFVDIRGSTELAEQLPVAQLSRLLSRFRGHVSTAALAHNGLVDKFIGDGALVVFGVHDAEPRAAAQALAFARELRLDHAAARGTGNLPGYDIGIGIHYGMVFCGIVGAQDRLEFTVLGDAVNVAARLENETKTHGVDLLVSEAVLREAEEPLEQWRKLGCDALRGRREPVGIYAECGA
ncbi:adenylate/guanylate cyclase domain-containing protein [Lichenifustis flavocetrariae]|uniref:CHASE3 domain-containing protein n=1 Tax=Lichenifustis flavocetrariae TaxID=2949735 RepID=A0AA42CMI1_9HYPH|nr:CHASE3 domain-containing protein [Lichenifustis flavocetrariae]MCW6511611.1 CHASE3 domain-containing protein [Lichenifustis flavocetrariae]